MLLSAGHMQTPPYRRVDLEEQDVELINFGRSVWLDHSRPRSLVVALFSPRFFPVTLVAGQALTGLLFSFLNSDFYDGGHINSTKPHSRFVRHPLRRSRCWPGKRRLWVSR